MDKEAFKKIRRIQIKTLRDVKDLFLGAYRSTFRGRGLEFEDVREYEPGDDVRHIDWNVTARSTGTYVKRFREERELTVMLIVDISASTRFSHTEKLKSQVIAEIAALIAFSAIKNQDKVGLLLFSDQVELYLPPRKSVRHVLRVIREILFFQPKGRGTKLSQALTFLGKVQRRQAICFLLSDFLTDDFRHEAALLSQRHELIALQIYDLHERVLPEMGFATLFDLETHVFSFIDTGDESVRLKYQEEAKKRAVILKRMLQKIDAALLAIPTDGSYLHVLQHFFQRRKRRA